MGFALLYLSDPYAPHVGSFPSISSRVAGYRSSSGCSSKPRAPLMSSDDGQSLRRIRAKSGMVLRLKAKSGPRSLKSFCIFRSEMNLERVVCCFGLDLLDSAGAGPAEEERKKLESAKHQTGRPIRVTHCQVKRAHAADNADSVELLCWQSVGAC